MDNVEMLEKADRNIANAKTQNEYEDALYWFARAIRVVFPEDEIIKLAKAKAKSPIVELVHCKDCRYLAGCAVQHIPAAYEDNGYCSRGEAAVAGERVQRTLTVDEMPRAPLGLNVAPSVEEAEAAQKENEG